MRPDIGSFVLIGLNEEKAQDACALCQLMLDKLNFSHIWSVSVVTVQKESTVTHLGSLHSPPEKLPQDRLSEQLHSNQRNLMTHERKSNNSGHSRPFRLITAPSL